MVNAAVQGRLFSEDIAFGASLTYATGGNTATVARGVSVERVARCSFKAQGTAAYVAEPVAGSESGQTFKYRVYEPGAGSTAMQEVANGATLSTSPSTLSADYEGT